LRPLQRSLLREGRKPLLAMVANQQIAAKPGDRRSLQPAQVSIVPANLYDSRA
jgi:hypothetical protein